MADMIEVSTATPAELLGAGRRHLAVRDFNSAAEVLAKACELLAKEHGDTADQCAEAYLWYGQALLGLSRDESGVLGDGMPGSGNVDDDDEEQDDDDNNDDNEQTEQNCEPEKSKTEHNEAESTSMEADTSTKEAESKPAQSTTSDAPGTSSEVTDNAEPSTSNDDANDESVVNMDSEDDVDNLQLAWEMLGKYKLKCQFFITYVKIASLKCCHWSLVGRIGNQIPFFFNTALYSLIGIISRILFNH